ncbi:MAG: hypothetical protein V4661_15855 [Pseudomonadota bacterium]
MTASVHEKLIERLRDAQAIGAASADRSAQQIAAALGEAADAITTLQNRVGELEEHIREQVTHVENRIADGKEMGAAVWRIALEDVAADNRKALKGDA